MSEHPSDRELTAFGQSALPPDVLLIVDDHLAICDTCRGRAAALSGAAKRLASATAAIHRELKGSPGHESREPPGWNIRWSRWVALGAVAASATIAIGLVRSASTAPAPTSAAPATVPTTTARLAESNALTRDERAMVDRALATGDLPIADAVAALRPPNSALMGGAARPADFSPLAPNGLVDDDRPTLAWSALETGGNGVLYRVDVFDSRYQPVARSAWLTDTRWTPDRPLAPGQTYVWQVTARSGGRDVTIPAPPQPEARFIVTDANQHTNLASLRRRAGGSHVALAVLLARAGVLDEAQRELSLASAAHPESSAVKRLQERLNAIR